MALENIVSGFLSKLFGNKSTSVGEALKETINEVMNNDQQPARQPAQPAQPRVEDRIEQDIVRDGYVWQSRLWRRHVMAQMFRLLHGKRGLPMSEANYDKCVSRRGNNYPWKMLKAEMHAQSLLWGDDREQFAERNRWFNKAVVEAMARDMGNGQLLSSLAAAGTPEALSRVVRSVSYCTSPKSEAWKNAYKGAGAYFTMKNLILFHNCQVHREDGIVLDRDASFRYISDLNSNPLTTGHDMFAAMMKLIIDNNFDWRG